MEEDEHSSRSPSPLNIKTRRRHARITRDDLANLDTTTFLSPRPAPSPASSPDSLKLAFPELLKFPCPPMSDPSSSPSIHSSGMPLTPSTSDSDDGLALPSPRFNPRRAAAIQPLSFNFNRESPDSDADSDTEWYHNEFSKLIATPAHSQYLQPSRPESVSIPSDFKIPTTKPKRASITSDTVYPRRRNSKSGSIIFPKYPPPPVPPIPEHLRSPPCPPPHIPSLDISRPPPRSSLPADCIFDLYMDGCNEGHADSDSSSAFSFSMYEIDFGEREHSVSASTSGECPNTLPQSPNSLDSEFAQEIDVKLDDARFELDYQLRLPLSIPATPFEADIAVSFEKLRERAVSALEPTPATVAAEIQPTPVLVESTTQSSLSTSSARAQDLLYTPTISSFSFSPSPSPVSFFDRTNDSPSFNREERVLKSKWSTSTLGSIQEEQAGKKNRERGRSASAKLKLYFGAGGSTPSKVSSKTSKRVSSSTKTLLPTPTSPQVFRSPMSPSPSASSRKPKTHTPSLSSSPMRWPQPRAYKSKRTSTQSQHFTPTHQATNSSDVIIIGYGYGAGLKRRGSNTTVSSDGGMSEVSASSCSSSGLRRKPIPIEMFLRNAA